MSNDQNNPTMQHLDEMTCLLYLERQLDRARAQEVSLHTGNCEACRTLLHALERESKLLAQAMFEEEEPLPARLAEWQQKAARSVQWIWTVVFGLAATGVYALYTGYIQPWQQQLEQAGFGGTNLLGLLVFQGAFWKGWQSMITLLEVIALLTIAGFGAAFFRRKVRRGAVMAVAMTVFCALAATPQLASATEFRKGETAEVKPEETIKGDTYLSGARIRMEGTVEGDVFVFGKEADVSGHVTGDVIAFAQTLRITGKVDGNVRAFVNNVTVLGSVGKNFMAGGDSLAVDSAGRVSGSATFFGSRMTMDGALGRDLLSFGEHLNVGGKVGGSILSKGNALTLGSQTVVEGPVRFDGRTPPEVQAGAKLAFQPEFHKVEHKRSEAGVGSVFWKIIWTAAFILLGLVLYVLMPQFAAETAAGGERYGASLGLGLLVIVGLFVASFIACITIVGLPLGVLGFTVEVFALTCAKIVVGTVIGRMLLGPGKDVWDLIGRMALGLVILRAVSLVLPFIPTAVPNIIYTLAIWMWGVGALSLALYKRFQPGAVANVPGIPMPPPMPPNTTVGGLQPV